MSLGQLLVLALIVVVVWLGTRLKKHEDRIETLEGKSQEAPEAE